MSIEQQYPHKPGNGKVFAGLILLAVGGVLLLQQLSWFIFPDWVLSWPMFLIILGIYIGTKNNFNKPAPAILIILGLIFLADDIVPDIDLSRIFWPLAIICLGIWMILRRNHHIDRRRYQNRWHNKFSNASFDNPFEQKMAGSDTPAVEETDSNYSKNYGAHYGDDYLDTVSVFSGAKKTILSKNFKGGEIVNVFGGTEIDFTMADINGRVTIDVTQIFGGVKLVVPSHWQVVADVASVFASTDDKRHPVGQQSPDKILVIKGTSIFAGIDIRSFM